MAGREALIAAALLLAAAVALAQPIQPYVPANRIKPAANVNGVMRYRVRLIGRNLCQTTKGWLTAPLCEDQVVSVGKVGGSSPGLELAATDASAALGTKTKTPWMPDNWDHRTEWWQEKNGQCKVTGSWQKCFHWERGDLAGSGTDAGAACHACDGRTVGGIPQPRLNTWQTGQYGQWELLVPKIWQKKVDDNPDKSVIDLKVPLSFMNVGRIPFCPNSYLAGSGFCNIKPVVLAGASADHFYIKQAYNYQGQLMPAQFRLVSVYREMMGCKDKYLGASTVCQVYGEPEDPRLGFYRGDDTAAFTTWQFSPTAPCQLAGGTCTATWQCCTVWGLRCVNNAGGGQCAGKPQPPGLSQVIPDTVNNIPQLTVDLIEPKNTGGLPVDSYDVVIARGAKNAISYRINTATLEAVFIEDEKDSDGKTMNGICGRDWKVYAATITAWGASDTTFFGTFTIPDCPVRPGPPQAAVVADTTGPAGEIFPRVTLLPPTNKYTIPITGYTAVLRESGTNNRAVAFTTNTAKPITITFTENFKLDQWCWKQFAEPKVWYDLTVFANTAVSTINGQPLVITQAYPAPPC